MQKIYASLLSFISIVILLFAFTGKANATGWSANKFNILFDNCSGILTVNINLTAYHNCAIGSNTDYVQYFTLSYKETDGSWTEFYTSPALGIGIFTGPGVGTHNNGASTQLYNLPSALLGSNIEIRMVGSWREDNCSPNADQFTAIDEVKSVSSTEMDAPTNLVVAQTPECSEIDLTWTNPDINASCPGASWYVYVYRTLPGQSEQYLQYVGQGTSFTDDSPLLNSYNGQNISYRVRVIHVLSNGYLSDSKYTSLESGITIGFPDPVGSIQASTGRCDGTIQVTWDNVGINHASYKLERRELPSGLWTTLVNTLPSSPQSYNDEEVEEFKEYEYRIYSRNGCGRISSSVATVSPGSLSGEPGGVAAIHSQIIPGVGVQLTWSPSANTDSYELERAQFGGGGSFFFALDNLGTDYWVVGDSLRTIDESLVQCQQYQYFIRSINDCSQNGILSSSNTNAFLVPDLQTTFNDNALSASKGFFSNRVQINWTVASNENFLNGFKIYRKQLGSVEDSVLIASVNSGSNLYIDNYADAGILYEYFVIGETQCDYTTIYSNVASDIGFRSPFGTVTGNVSYTGGIAVKGVRISASSTSQIDGQSLALSGSDSISIASSASLQFQNAFVFESWLRPANLSSDFTLAHRQGLFTISYNASGQSFSFEVEHADASLSSMDVDASTLLENNFVQVAFQFANDSLYFFKNGQRIQAIEASGNGDLATSASPIVIGNAYEGVIDECRIWSNAKSDLQVKQGHSRIMVGGEPGLKAYLRFNEGTGQWAYDISKLGNAFNKNHAEFLGNPVWSETIPTSSQLSIASYTDVDGNYVMTVPYNGLGEGFVLTPSYLIHEFDPGTRALFIGDGQIIHNNIDFEDISSFTVSGSVFYANTSCPASGVILSVDGEQIVVDGLPAITDNDGLFEIQVPIGEHFVSVSKQGHIFSVGRFPEVDKFNFQDDKADMGFIDSTLIKVVGRVVGGLREANKKPGLDLSKNNIGVAKLQFLSQLGGGCAGDTVFTDPMTGEYVTFLPPLKYVPTVGIENDPTIDFGVLELLDLSGNPQYFAAYDTTFTTDGMIAEIDSVKYNKRLDYIHRVEPIIIVKDRNGVDDFIGDSLYTYINPNTGDTLIRNLRTDPFRWPIFTEQEDDYLYRALIKVFEPYINADNTALIDSVPSTDGLLTINNDMADVETSQIELSEVNSPDSLKFLVYSFKAERPNFSENISIPDYSFTGIIEVNVVNGAGNAISWNPIPSLEVPLGGDQKFRAVYLGSKTDGAQFVTTGPEVPDYVLRDPPGSGSSATREVGTVKSTSSSWAWNLGSKAHMADAVFLGAKFSIGLGVSTATEIENNVTAGFSASLSGGRKGTQEIKTTNTQSWSTNSGGTSPGSGSDVYVGRSMNVQFGVADHLAIVPDSLCDQVECLGTANPGFAYAKQYSLSIVPGGYQTTFIYNQNNILDEQIPNLIELRDIILQSNSKYTSHLAIDNENYGLNNDDLVFGALASTDNPGQGEFADLTGPSYTYAAINEEDSLIGDSVRFINNQVKQWQNAIRLNEWEKANISNTTVRDSLKANELQKLEDDNEDMLAAYYTLAALNGIGGLTVAYGLIATPVPGSSFVGYAVFAVTTATGIVQAELAEEFEAYQQAKDRIEEKFAQTTPVTYSMSGGETFSSSMTHETATTTSHSIEYGMTASLKAEVKGKVNNNGIGFEKGIEMSFDSSRDWGEASGSSETVSFTLTDADLTDFFAVKVYPSLLGWGPVFKKQAGGQTSCPYEGEELSLFYEPGTVLSNATLQVDKPTLAVSPSILYNVPITESAVFNLTLGNASESDHDRTYNVSLVSSSNPFGAIATIDGVSNISVTVPAGSSVNKVLAIQKGPGAVYEYDSLLFVITAPCEGMKLSDSVYVSARFIPTCTDVEFVIPEELWVANTFNNDTIPSAIAGYNINFFDFEELKVEYKPSNESQWIGLKTFYRDTTGLNDPDASPIPTGQSFTLYDWDIAQLTDGNYDLRSRSVCIQADKTSITYSGIIDRIKPHVFGTPSPADGILSPNDDIGITFNEPVDLGALTQLNFDVRGVLNGTETRHGSSLFFNGSDSYLEVQAGAPFKNRDFTIQVAVRRAGTNAETILAQGQNVAEEIYLGFNDANKLVFRINGEEVISNESFDNDLWHYIGLSYSFENETADMYVANESFAGLINVGNNSIFPAYEGIGRMLIGKQDYGSASPFNGNIHELRIWDRALSFDEFSLTMNKILPNNEAGLLYNWRMDELEGIIVEDHIRRRDAVNNGAQWAVEPVGASADFDGASNYINVSTGEVLITQDMNFTMELWFRGSGTNAATLFSNGSGNGLLSDSLYSWVLDRDLSGAINFTNNGTVFNVTNQNYFDGQWHHLAIVLNRNANITSIIDGNIENSVPSTPFKQFSGSSMSLGAYVYNTGTGMNVSNFFEGEVDEFRMWNTNRKVEQIKRDKRNRMMGNEPGLLIYLPFENYTTDPTGIAILTASFDEQINTVNNVVESNGTVLLEESPLIRIQRPIESIAFTYAVNNDQIIITPTSAAEMIENVTLDVTVSNVRDLQGNVMASPVTWIAYMDKNQVVWDEDMLSFEKAVGDELTFTSQIVNQGGAEKAFNIQNLPSWLSADPISGSIPPNSSLLVDFTVDPLVNIGDYVQDVHLLTDFNYPEKLSIELKVRETPPNWDFDPSDFQYSMGIIGMLEIQGINSTDAEDILVAFVDGETRGVQALSYMEDLDRYLVYLDVYSNLSSGEDITFKIWDASAGILYSHISPEFIPFEANQLIGTPLLPELFATDFEIEAEIVLSEGWNWFSYYLQNPDSSDFDVLFENLNSVTGDQVNGQDEFANYSGLSGWVGPLENTGIRSEEGYKFFKNQTDTLVIQGDIIDPSTRVIDMNAGWNWLGFISIRNQGIDQALGNLTPSEGDQIKARSNFSVYVNNAIGWQGTLNTLVPGQGYMYKAAIDQSFTFPYAGYFKKEVASDKPLANPVWKVNYGAFANNMNLILTVIDSCEMPKGTLIGAFDSEGVIRGMAEFKHYEDMDRAFLTINAESGMLLSLKLIKGKSGELYPSIATIPFESNSLKGSFDNPELIYSGELFCELEAGIQNSNFEVFPTIFTDKIWLKYKAIKADDAARIDIYDMKGRVLFSQTTSIRKGQNEMEISLDDLNLASEPYLIRLVSVNGVEMQRIIKTN